jgi:hypothetical protein
MIQSRVVRFVIRVAVYCLPALAALRLDIVSDPDIWWHTRIGQWIVQHGTVPVTDPFSSFGAGKTWFAYSWAFDVVLYELQHRWGLRGYVGYVAVMSLAIAVALFHLIERFEPRFIWAAALTAMGLFVLVPLYTPRSWLITLLFFLWLLNILTIYRAGGNRKMLLLLPPMFFIWANIHIQFVYGLVALVIASLEPLLGKYFGEQQASERRWDLPVVTLFCIFATFVNPYGVWLYRTVGVYARQHPDLIQEMQPLRIHSVSEWVFLVTLLLSVFVMGRRGHLKFFPIMLLAFGVVAAFKAGRDVWVAMFAALYILADSEQAPLSRRVKVPLAALCASAVVIVAIAGVRHLSDDRLQGFVASHFPAKAVTVISQNQYRGPLFNDYDWGGYLIWMLPQLPVAIDGRMDLQGDAHFKQNWDTWMAAPEWTADPQLREANIVIASRKLPLTSVLRLDPRFEIVHEDDVAVVFLRRATSSTNSSGQK